MHESSDIRCYAVDGTAKSVKSDATLTQCGCLSLCNRAYQVIDAFARQQSGEDVGFGAVSDPLQPALRILAGKMTFTHRIAITTTFGHHSIEQSGTGCITTRWRNTDTADKLLK